MRKFKRSDVTLILAVVGTLTGLIGAFLGVVNTYWHITSDVIELSVHPNPVLKRDGNILILPQDPEELEFYLKGGNEPKEIVITITNRSRATAFVTVVGFIDRHNQKRFGLISTDAEGKHTMELMSKEPKNVDTKVTPKLRTALLHGIDRAFAETSDGKLFFGSTPVWDAYLRWLKKPNKSLQPTQP